MPNKPATQHRSIRVPDELWEKMLRATADQGTTIAEVTRDCYEQYVRAYENRYALRDPGGADDSASDPGASGKRQVPPKEWGTPLLHHNLIAA